MASAGLPQRRRHPIVFGPGGGPGESDSPPDHHQFPQSAHRRRQVFTTAWHYPVPRLCGPPSDPTSTLAPHHGAKIEFDFASSLPPLPASRTMSRGNLGSAIVLSSRMTERNY